MNTKRTCLHCELELVGRRDKKFCADYCRVAYHNTLHQSRNNLVRKINNILRRNRMILAKLRNAGKKETTRRTLSEKGFIFSLHTSSKLNQEGQVIYFCYDQGWVQVNNQHLSLVEGKS